MVTPPLARKKQAYSIKGFVEKLGEFIKYNKSLTIGLVILGIIIIMAIFADFIAPYHYAKRFPELRFGAPSGEHPFGTTLLGYDVLSRVIYGTQVALIIAFSGTILAVIIGIPLGIVSGYFGGRVDRILTLIADSIYSFPSLLLAITLAIYLAGFGIFKTVAAVSFATA
ncbi:MAG: ABC transporter permease, partial [Candidatus Hodarchaeota archaeon]